jgi:radical SAM superfamily enzyme YgiQ (UPF0313 family)
MDVLFIIPGNSNGIYQDLANTYSSIEPPTWALLLAESCRSVKFTVGLIDANAEQLSTQAVIDRINQMSPRLLCFVVYGQNVNAGTVSMSGAVELANNIKVANISIPIAFLGSHMQALPIKTLEDEKSVDIVFVNEGVYALRSLLIALASDNPRLDGVKGIGYRKDGVPFLTAPERLVPQDRLDIDLPGYAWDLLPYRSTPMDLYRSPMWHANYNHNKRTPYGTIYTSLGCKFGCDFCMINILNRTDNDPVGVASNYRIMRCWSKDFVIREIEKLVARGVYTIRITDEMFLLNPNHYIPICEELSKKDYADKLLLWSYSRIDTVAKNPVILQLLRKAGFRWLALGIESGDRNIRMEVSKGKFENIDIKNVIESVQTAGIEVMGNYIFGLPDDTMESMQNTLHLSLDLCTSGWNAYAVMPLPGSKLYNDALTKGYQLPSDYSGYSFHSYTTTPMPTNHISAAEVLRFRDNAYTTYHTNKAFLDRIETKFGKSEVNNILEMTKVKLKRKILQ